MLATDKNALICDMAETYHIIDIYAIPLKTLAILACGLRDDSRIKSKITGLDADMMHLYLAMIIDRLTTLVWQQTEDGISGRNRPESLALAMLNQEEQSIKDDIVGFDSIETFEATRKMIIGG